MPNRVTFLSHFVICLACAAGAVFAWRAGAIQATYANDASMMTSVIAALFVGTAVHLGWQAWRVDTPYLGDADWGYTAAELCLIAGVIGMALGLALQGKAIAAGGSAVFGAWATQLDATIAGCVASAIILIMTFSLEHGIKQQ